MRSIAGRSRPWCAAGLLLAATVTTVGCGDRSRPVVTPVSPTGPAGAPIGYALVTSQPGLQVSGTSTPDNLCPAPPAATDTTHNQPSIATLIDFSGDSIIAQASSGFRAFASVMSPTSNEVYSLNCDGTISGIPVVSTLQANQISTTTLFSRAVGPDGSLIGNPIVQTNAVVQNTATYVVNQGNNLDGTAHNSVSALSVTSPPALIQDIPVAPSVISVSGAPTSQRVYAISQGATGSTAVAWGACSTPANVTTPGEADGIDTATNTVSSRIPVGICPVSGLTTPDGLRTFILNRGSGTVTVINSQQDALDTNVNGNGTIPVGAGPVQAAYFPQAALLMTANYDSGTVSFISVPLDSFGNDGPGFGQVLKTVAVGAHPAAITVLGDGSRAYVALQGDISSPTGASGAVAIVSLTGFNLENTIPVAGHPRIIASTYNNPQGKVYVVAPDSNELTIIRTDVDTISAQVQLQGCGVDVKTNYQYVGQSNLAGSSLTANTYVNASYSAGSGAPATPYSCAP